MATYQITSPEGEKFKITAPDNASEDEVMAYARQNFESAAPEKGFFDKVQDRYNERVQEVSQTIEDYATGVLSNRREVDTDSLIGKSRALETPIGKASREAGALGEAGVQIAGKTAGFVFDVAGEGIISLGKGVLAVVPDYIEDPVKEKIIQGWDAVMDTEVGKLAVEAVKGGAKTWGKFKKENPRAAKDIESAVNITALLAPAKVKKNAEPTKIGRTADIIEKKAQEQIAKTREGFVSDLVLPKQTAKVRIDQVSRTTEKGIGPFKQNVIKLSAREQEMADIITKLRGLSPKNTIQRNYNVIASENLKKAKQLERSLSARKIPVSKTRVSTAIDNTIDNVAATNPLIVGNAELTARRAGEMAKQLINESDGTAAGLLRSRRKFDNWVLRQKGEKAFSSDVDNALTISVREIRSKINDLTDDAVKLHGQRKGEMRVAGIKGSLKEQSKLYEAMENIAPKAADEQATAIGRAWQNASKVIRFSEKPTRELALLAGMSAVGAAYAFAPYVAGALAVGGAVVYGGRLVMSPGTKKALSKLIRMVDKAISTSENPSMIKQLRLDRALILEAMKASEISENDLETGER